MPVRRKQLWCNYVVLSSASIPLAGDLTVVDGVSTTHTIEWTKDGTTAEAVNNTASTHHKEIGNGLYTILITNLETDCDSGAITGTSTTSGAVIVPASFTFEYAPIIPTFGGYTLKTPLNALTIEVGPFWDTSGNIKQNHPILDDDIQINYGAYSPAPTGATICLTRSDGYADLPVGATSPGNWTASEGWFRVDIKSSGCLDYFIPQVMVGSEESSGALGYLYDSFGNTLELQPTPSNNNPWWRSTDATISVVYDVTFPATPWLYTSPTLSIYGANPAGDYMNGAVIGVTLTNAIEDISGGAGGGSTTDAVDAAGFTPADRLAYMMANSTWPFAIQVTYNNLVDSYIAVDFVQGYPIYYGHRDIFGLGSTYYLRPFTSSLSAYAGQWCFTLTKASVDDTDIVAYADAGIGPVGVYTFTDALGLSGTFTTIGVGTSAQQLTSISYTITVQSTTGSLLQGVQVWITSDITGLHVMAGTLQTNAIGQVVFDLPVGIYYVWRQYTGYNFTNPQAITVT